ncbi:site-specific DNA-methyltransferase [Arcobacter sp. F155]|uniref:site-specific DNA-methyltransferase n=1 Tax=Arcobacter sp. F155 TaxID=2044512 RepID=UPI00100A5443|nr:site-specific DNA-methyltransferase [Arcobacter sp. F155]RXJ77077.1 site-specific DNA-methyltransferase [Arcobacter sp. F155]
MSEQLDLGIDNTVDNVEEYQFKPIKGYPMLNWKGKRPFRSTRYFPAQLKEVHGSDVDGWLNKIFWGDNIQVMSHLLKNYRGQVDLIYIDPPFDSKADYKKKIKLKNKQIKTDTSFLEEKQYTDIWSNDEYLQFMYERLVLIRELLSDNGCLYLHCDPTKGHYLKIILDEVFGQNNFKNEIIWRNTSSHSNSNTYGNIHQNIFYYSKNSENLFWNNEYKFPYEKDYIEQYYRYKDDDGRVFKSEDLTVPSRNENNFFEFCGKFPSGTRGWGYKLNELEEMLSNNLIYITKNGFPRFKRYLDENDGIKPQSLWTGKEVYTVGSWSEESSIGYPTQKPESLLSRIINISSNPGDLIFDCFMGSGTTMAVAQKLGRRFIGADINLGSIQTTTKRLRNIIDENLNDEDELKSCGFELYNVNNYDIFKNPVQAKELLIEALEIDKLNGSYFDGMKDGRKVKIMPINRIATKKDVSDLITNLDYKAYEKEVETNPNKKVDDILLVCMGHDLDIKPHFQKECPFNIDIEVYDILKEGSGIVFKRDSEASIEVNESTLTVNKFYPNTLLEKLRQDGTEVEDWRETVESIMIDTNYDGSVFEPSIVDIPEKKELVSGSYELPEDAGTIAIKITDLLSESYFEVLNG